MRSGFGQKLGFIAYQVIAWTFIALCVLMIHDFSRQNAGHSNALSLEVTDVVYRVLEKPVGKINRNSKAFERLHGYVRKAAHALEFALLALALMLALAPTRMRLGTRVFATLLFCAAFAGYDEWSQASSAGRSPALKDVGIDTLGAAAGCAATLMVRQMAVWEIRYKAARRRGSAPRSGRGRRPDGAS